MKTNIQEHRAHSETEIPSEAVFPAETGDVIKRNSTPICGFTATTKTQILEALGDENKPMMGDLMRAQKDILASLNEGKKKDVETSVFEVVKNFSGLQGKSAEIGRRIYEIMTNPENYQTEEPQKQEKKLEKNIDITPENVTLFDRLYKKANSQKGHSFKLGAIPKFSNSGNDFEYLTFFDVNGGKYDHGYDKGECALDKIIADKENIKKKPRQAYFGHENSDLDCKGSFFAILKILCDEFNEDDPATQQLTKYIHAFDLGEWSSDSLNFEEANLGYLDNVVNQSIERSCFHKTIDNEICIYKQNADAEIKKQKSMLYSENNQLNTESRRKKLFLKIDTEIKELKQMISAKENESKAETNQEKMILIDNSIKQDELQIKIKSDLKALLKQILKNETSEIEHIDIRELTKQLYTKGVSKINKKWHTKVEFLRIKVMFEVFDRITQNNLSPRHLKAEDFKDMVFNIGKKKLNLSDEINKYHDLHKIALEDFYQNARQYKLKNGDRIVFNPNKNLSCFELYQKGVEIIFSGRGIMIKPECAEKYRNKILLLTQLLDAKETVRRQEIYDKNPERYNKEDFLRTNIPVEGYLNSDPWKCGKGKESERACTFITQPGIGRTRSVLEPGEIKSLFEEVFGVDRWEYVAPEVKEIENFGMGNLDANI